LEPNDEENTLDLHSMFYQNAVATVENEKQEIFNHRHSLLLPI
jgi:hypothetical protein